MTQKAYCTGCDHYLHDDCRYHIKLHSSSGNEPDKTCLFRTQEPVKVPMTYSRPIDRSNPRNVKCEHCKHFDKGEATTAKNLRHGVGACTKDPKKPDWIEYWKKRPCFEWPEE